MAAKRTEPGDDEKTHHDAGEGVGNNVSLDKKGERDCAH